MTLPLGSFLQEEDSEYHAHAKEGRAISASALKVFRESPRDYQARYRTGEVKHAESPALVLGRAAHCLILEGSAKFQESFVVIEDLDPELGFINKRTGEVYGENTKAWRSAKDALDAVRPGLQLLSKAQWNQCQGMAEAVRANEVAAKQLEHGQPEKVFRHQVEGEPFARQCKVDWVGEWGQGGTVLVDLKTTEDLRSFRSRALKFGYPEQLAFYRDLFGRTVPNGCGCGVPVLLVAVEKNPPYKVGCWNFQSSELSSIQKENEYQVKELARLWDLNENWPTGWEKVRPFFEPENFGG